MHKFNLRSLRLSLKFRPEILRLILKMRCNIKRKKAVITNLKKQLQKMQHPVSSAVPTENIEPNPNCTQHQADIKSVEPTTELNENLENDTNIKNDPDAFVLHSQNPIKTDRSTQTDLSTSNTENSSEFKIKKKNIEDNSSTFNKAEIKKDEPAWNTDKDREQKSIAEQVKEAAQDAMKQSGMVYVESAGMYYDYKTGYYYNSELGLYYHTDTECYYYYSDEKQTFVFHSYPDRSASSANEALLAHEKRKARKHKMERKKEDDIDNLTKNLSQEKEEGPQEAKKMKKKKNKKNKSSEIENGSDEKLETKNLETNESVTKINEGSDVIENSESVKQNGESNDGAEVELEDGECSDTSSESSDDEDEKSDVSTSTASDDDAVAKHHPPCMRVIVRETTLPKLKVGSLFIVTKDGGTVGREGDHHTFLLRDHNVSRNHLEISYDDSRKSYMAKDLGSKNGSILNGSRISASQVPSGPVEIVHGSTLQLGETKLLCHIHPGNDTCGHCEPGLLMEAIEKEKKAAYTRTCSVQMQHQLELARLKNKYAPQPLAIEETAYNDRAQARREKVGSSHHSEKTQSADIETSIAPENKGFKLLEKMGWSKGEGLGKDSQGNIEPVPLVSNDGTAGLGANLPPKPKATPLGQATLRLANRTKILKPPAKAFQQADEGSESE